MANQNYDLNVLSLGAGVQSTAVYLMALDGQFDSIPDCAIFADTQWEPAEVYVQLQRLIEEGGKTIPIHVVTTGNLREDVLKVVGPPGQRLGRVANPPFYVKRNEEESRIDNLPPDEGGKLWRGCTSEYKIKPIHKKIRSLLGYQKGERIHKNVRQWFGISTDEAQRMRDSRERWIANYYPLIEKLFSRTDCEKYLKRRGYGEVIKSSCIGCPFHSNHTWVHMKRHRPDDWADAVDFDHKLRNGKLPGVIGDAYLSRRCEPLEEAIKHDYDENQMDLWNEECEGMCGV